MAPEVLWSNGRLVPRNASPLVYQDHVYTINSAGVLNCLDAANGDLQWQQRLRGGFWASPVAADGKIYCVNEAGTAFVVAADQGRNAGDQRTGRDNRCHASDRHGSDLPPFRSASVFLLREEVRKRLPMTKTNRWLRVRPYLLALVIPFTGGAVSSAESAGKPSPSRCVSLRPRCGPSWKHAASPVTGPMRR